MAVRLDPVLVVVDLWCKNLLNILKSIQIKIIYNVTVLNPQLRSEIALTSLKIPTYIND
jgi:hypothetical protein